jgi:hypothetical protein
MLRVVHPTQNLCCAHIHVGALGYEKNRQLRSLDKRSVIRVLGGASRSVFHRDSNPWAM